MYIGRRRRILGGRLYATLNIILITFYIREVSLRAVARFNIAERYKVETRRRRGAYNRCKYITEIVFLNFSAVTL